MNSMKWHWLKRPPARMSSITFLALAVPWHTPTFKVAPSSHSQSGNKCCNSAGDRPDLGHRHLGVAHALEPAERNDVGVVEELFHLFARDQFQDRAQARPP